MADQEGAPAAEEAAPPDPPVIQPPADEAGQAVDGAVAEAADGGEPAADLAEEPAPNSQQLFPPMEGEEGAAVIDPSLYTAAPPQYDDQASPSAALDEAGNPLPADRIAAADPADDDADGGVGYSVMDPPPAEQLLDEAGNSVDAQGQQYDAMALPRDQYDVHGNPRIFSDVPPPDVYGDLDAEAPAEEEAPAPPPVAEEEAVAPPAEEEAPPPFEEAPPAPYEEPPQEQFDPMPPQEPYEMAPAEEPQPLQPYDVNAFEAHYGALVEEAAQEQEQPQDVQMDQQQEQPQDYGAPAGMQYNDGYSAGQDNGLYDSFNQQGGTYGAGQLGVNGEDMGSAALAAELVAEREKHESQLKMEAKAREELEDMILRIEKHFKAEQAARKKAEELLQQAIAAELDANNRLEDCQKKRRDDLRVLDSEREAVKRERVALEGMRQDFEAELQAARAEVARAQEALQSTEDRIKAAEQVERVRLENEYQNKLTVMSGELDRMREELAMRTMVMSEEMERWRQQAQLTAAAVMEAKNDVIERKKELETTKEKMDRLLDKLYVGRERGIELSGAIAAAQFHNGASNQRLMNNWVNGLNHGGPMAGMGGGFGGGMAGGMGGGFGGMAGGFGRPAGLPPIFMNGMGGAQAPMMMPGQMGGGVPKLPPINGGGQYGGGGGLVLMQMAPQQQQQQQYMQQPQFAQQGQPQYGQPPQQGRPNSNPEGRGDPRASPGGNTYTSQSEGGGPDDSPSPTGQYDHVQSKFAQAAAQVGANANGQKQAQLQQQRKGGAKSAGAKKPDRFEEGKKDMARITAMSRKWN